MKILELKNVNFYFSNKKVIDNISLDIYDNEIISIVGHNGSGKTTLGKIIALLLKINSGDMFFCGQKINFDCDNFDIHRNIGFVFQNPDNQFFGATVRDDIAFGLENNAISADEMEYKIQSVAKEIGIIDLLDKDVQCLSGGQKQKVAIADILVLNPKIIIFDESFAMLDNENKKKILHLIKTIKDKKHITIIHITHNLEETLNSDRIIVMNHGKIFLEGNPNFIFSQEQKLCSIGFKIPFIIELNKKLNDACLLKDNFYDLESLVNNICK